jgi:hypothetical protein
MDDKLKIKRLKRIIDELLRTAYGDKFLIENLELAEKYTFDSEWVENEFIVIANLRLNQNSDISDIYILQVEDLILNYVGVDCSLNFL